MKSLFERILTAIGLVGGYALTSVVFLAIILGFGFLAAELIARTIVEPSAWIVVADIMTVVLIGYVVTRKRFREGLAEFWKQVRRNM